MEDPDDSICSDVNTSSADICGSSIAVESAAGDPAKAEAPTDQSNPSLLRDNISQEMLTELEGMGFARIPAEKALYFTSNQNVEAAVQWLGDHAEDTDFLEPLQEGKVEPPKPKMSKEEAQARAYELQMKLKAEREKREKQEALDAERNRMQSQKMLQEAQRKLDEQQRRRDIDAIKREKEDHEREKQRQREIARQEWRERFGDSVPYPGNLSSNSGGGEDHAKNVDIDLAGKSKKDQAAHWIGKLRKYKDLDAAKLKTCIETLKLYIGNAMNNPTEPKYHTIKASNTGFQTRVAGYPEAIELLQVCGFGLREDPSAGRIYSITGPIDGFTCGQAVKFLDLIIRQM